MGSRLGPPGWYEGGLLPLALDLGRRLLPAFDTPLGIPVHRVNLRTGIPYGATVQSSRLAGIRIFVLSFVASGGSLRHSSADPFAISVHTCSGFRSRQRSAANANAARPRDFDLFSSLLGATPPFPMH